MRADERAFLDDRDLKLADLAAFFVALFDQSVMLDDLILEMKRSREIRGPRAYKHDIHRYLFTFDHK